VSFQSNTYPKLFKLILILCIMNERTLGRTLSRQDSRKSEYGIVGKTMIIGGKIAAATILACALYSINKSYVSNNKKANELIEQGDRIAITEFYNSFDTPHWKFISRPEYNALEKEVNLAPTDEEPIR